MARNDFPHTAAGIPPALAMTWRCGLLAGHASGARPHDPEGNDPAAAHSDEMRHILKARTAVMQADAQRTLAACVNRNLPDRSKLFYPANDTVCVAILGAWIGAWRAIGHTGSKLILEMGEK